MKKAFFVAIACLIPALAFAGEGPHWGYEGKLGPAYWGELSPEYTPCARGKNQSPIDLRDFIASELKPIDFRYQAGGHEIINNGHSVQVNYKPGSSILVDGHAFELKQVHFHAPSENLISGRSFPMEAHLVHANPRKGLAVIAVMFVQGESNASLAGIWAKMPARSGEIKEMVVPHAPDGLLPSDRDYYRYNGSLTTPPCTEGVRWLVLKQPVSASPAQIETFARAMGFANNRPVQPVNARPVLE